MFYILVRKMAKIRITNKILTWTIAAVSIPFLFYGLLLACRAFLCDQFVTPTYSMEPTLVPGDRILVDKTIMGARIYSDFHFDKEGQELKTWRTRGTRGIERNDVVVFNFPYKDDKVKFVINYVYCKRCLALPGDSISVEGGFYKNNNFKGELGYIPAQDQLAHTPDSLFDYWVFHLPPHNGQLLWTLKDMGPLYVPRKGDIITITPREASIYKILLEWETGKKIEEDWERGYALTDGKPITHHQFAHDYYFMAGDNVMNSNDSRYWGLVPEEFIIGVATHISYHKDRDKGIMEWNKVMRRIESYSHNN